MGLLAASDAKPGAIALVAAPGLMMSATGFASYAVDEDYYQTTLLSGLTLAAAAGHSVMATSRIEPREALWVSAGAELMQAGLYALDAALRRPISRRRLASDYAKIRSPRARAQLSIAELRALEQDLQRGDPYLSPWLLHSPLLIGSAANGVIAALPGKSSNQRWFAGSLALVLLLQSGGAIDTSLRNGYRSYQRRATRLGLRLAVDIGSIRLSGGF